jgi:phage replication initiation protein
VEVHGVDKSKGYVLIDWCAGTFPPSPSRGPVSELKEVLKQCVIPGHHVELVEQGKGWLGFECSWEIQILTGVGTAKAGKIGAGGNGGKCHFSLTGEGCALIEDWSPLQYLLHFNKGYLTRVDVALDDLEGRRSLKEMRERYEVGEFNCGGRRPAIQSITNSDSKGDTLNIGSRAGGKLIRCYEKGKQLGNPDSDWLRVEVELHRKDRILPLDILSRPADFLAGAVPWVANLYQLAAEKIKTVKEKAKLTLAKFLENLRQQAGKAIGWMQKVGITPETIVQRIGRDDGTPKRLSLAGISDALLDLHLISKQRAEQLADGCATPCPF